MAAAAAFAEPLTQQQVAMAAAGRRRRALLGRVLALGGAGALLAALDVALPAIFGLFDRTPGLAELAAAALAHVACAALGVALGLLATPPAARRPPAAFMVIVVYLVLAVPLYDLAPALSPAAWLAATLNDAAPHTLGARSSWARSPPWSRRGWRWPPATPCAGVRVTMPTVAIDAREARAERPRGHGRYARELIAAQRRLGVHDVREDVGGMGPEVLWEQVAWPRRLARHPPDLVHAPSGLLPLRRPCPGLVSVHDLAFEAHDDLAPRAAWRYRTFVRDRCARGADAVRVGVHGGRRGRALRRRPRQAARVPYAPALAHGDAPLPDGPPYLLAVGDQRPSRNLERLVAAFAALRAGELPDHRLVLAGAGARPPRGRRRRGHRLARRRAAGRAHARGRRARAPEPLRGLRARRARGDGARGSGGGRRCGRPARDVRRSRRALDPLDPDAIAAAVLRARARRDELAAAGRERAALFTWDATAEATALVYRELL